MKARVPLQQLLNNAEAKGDKKLIGCDSPVAAGDGGGGAQTVKSLLIALAEAGPSKLPAMVGLGVGSGGGGGSKTGGGDRGGGGDCGGGDSGRGDGGGGDGGGGLLSSSTAQACAISRYSNSLPR